MSSRHRNNVVVIVFDLIYELEPVKFAEFLGLVMNISDTPARSRGKIKTFEFLVITQICYQRVL